jgi:hypothetical protein
MANNKKSLYGYGSLKMMNKRRDTDDTRHEDY